jgi:bla regulator protein BlaR1
MESLFSGFQLIYIRLLDYNVDVSIMICLVYIIRLATQKRLPSWWNYSLWLILLIRMLIPFGFEKYLDLFNFVPALTENGLLELSPIIISANSKTQVWNLQIEQVLLAVWLGGVILFGAYILFKNFNFWMIIKSKPLLTDKKVLDLLEECKNRMKIHTVLGIIITEKVRSPALFGYIRPRLLLPEGTLEKLNNTELAYIFMHELGHLKHHDIGISWLLSIMQIIHWFNPLVWLAFYHMRVDQETACDASVLSRIKHSQSTDYANAIIGFLIKFRQNHQLPALAGIMETKSQTKRRITMISNYKSSSRKNTVVAFALLILIGFISFTLSCISGVKQAQPEKGAYNLNELDTKPRVTRRFPPKYPYEAAQQGIEGKVLIKFVLTKEGTVKEPLVVESNPEGVFDEAALEAVKQYKFNPGTIDGKAVDCIIRMPIVFELGAGPEKTDS